MIATCAQSLFPGSLPAALWHPGRLYLDRPLLLDAAPADLYDHTQLGEYHAANEHPGRGRLFSMTIVMVTGDFDLSVGALASLVGIVAGTTFQNEGTSRRGRHD